MVARKKNNTSNEGNNVSGLSKGIATKSPSNPEQLYGCTAHVVETAFVDVHNVGSKPLTGAVVSTPSIMDDELDTVHWHTVLKTLKAIAKETKALEDTSKACTLAMALMDLPSGTPKDAIRHRYLRWSVATHPDKGGSIQRFTLLLDAYEVAYLYTK